MNEELPAAVFPRGGVRDADTPPTPAVVRWREQSQRRRQRVAVVGTGVSGLVTARLLSARHDVEVFEAAPRLGGHVHTHEVEWEGRRHVIDTGFIVFNHRTYPNFTRLLEILGVASRPSEMSFSVRCDRSRLEYNGSSLAQLFVQKRNLLRPSFLGMIRDILRFNREAPGRLEQADESLTLGQLLEAGRYSRAFIEHYVVPMGAAIWSAEPRRMLEFPALTFVRFFHNHGMLSVDDRPEWRTVVGGSRRYVDAIVEPFADRIHLGTPVRSIRRRTEGVLLQVGDEAEPRTFDAVVLAVHSDQALALLADPSQAEWDVLGAIPYQENEAVLHTDTSILPRRRKAWAAWNYHLPVEEQQRLSVTYDMNILQGLQDPETFCVSLNPSAPIDPRRVIKRMTYQHPIFTRAGIAAQSRKAEIDATRRTFYCGAYWSYGFHEDGVVSALSVARQFGIDGIDAATELASGVVSPAASVVTPGSPQPAPRLSPVGSIG